MSCGGDQGVRAYLLTFKAQSVKVPMSKMTLLVSRIVLIISMGVWKLNYKEVFAHMNDLDSNAYHVYIIIVVTFVIFHIMYKMCIQYHRPNKESH